MAIIRYCNVMVSVKLMVKIEEGKLIEDMISDMNYDFEMAEDWGAHIEDMEIMEAHEILEVPGENN